MTRKILNVKDVPYENLEKYFFRRWFVNKINK